MLELVHVQIDWPPAEAAIAAEATLRQVESACNNRLSHSSDLIEQNVALLASLKKRLERLEQRLRKGTRPARESLG